MAIVSMTKIRLAIDRSVADRVLTAIQTLGLVELSPLSADEFNLTKWSPESFPADYKTTSLEAAVKVLSQYAKRPIIKSALEGETVIASETRIAQVVNHFEAEPILQQITHWETNLNHLTAEAKALTEQKYQLLPWEKWPIELDRPRQTNRVVEITAAGQTEQCQALVDRLINWDRPIDWQTADNRTIAIYGLKEDQEQILALIKEYDLMPVTLPVAPGRVTEVLARIDQDLAIINRHKEAISRELAGLTVYLPELKILADYYQWQKDCHQTKALASFSRQVVFYEGWCPAEALTDIRQTISRQTAWFTLETITTKETPPVEINNWSLTRPFESVTRLYGLPGPTDLDPTPWLAGFFFVFFGLSLTDIGYGFILAGLAVWFLYWYRLPPATQSLVTLLAFGGLASILAGILFGGFFGLATDHWPAWLLAWQIFDPINDPLPIFYLVLALGVIQIMVGLILAIIRQIRLGQSLAGLADHGPWLLAFGLAGIIVGQTIGWLSPPRLVIIGLTVGVIGLLVATQGRRETGWPAKLGKGVLSLYGAVGYLSDILSYSRLLALGLATTALAFSVNMIAKLAWETLPIGGAVAAVIVLIAGHGFTIIVNVLGAFVHSARLQFVEFFKGFIVEVGRPFKPLARRQRHVTLALNKDY